MNDASKFLSLIAAASLSLNLPARAGDNISSPNGQFAPNIAPYLLKTKQAAPVSLNQRQMSLEEMIQRAPYPSQFLQAIPLHGVRVPGLASKTVDTLGFNYFIVLDNTGYTRMSEIYRDSRLAGKSNFVTADSIVHPYLAFSNRVLADVAVKQMRPDIGLLLQAVAQSAVEDYKHAQDLEVRDDIERNIAFLSVGMRLLNPHAEMPRVGRVPEMVDEELANIFAGKQTQSVIFQRKEDFSFLKPMGWYTANSNLQNFYRCRQWLSLMAFPVMDVSIGTDRNETNAFRRSVLLYRNLDNADVLGKPAYDLWKKIVKANELFGTQMDNVRERTLYPTDYKQVFQTRESELRVVVNSLAEPLYRTKLMLTIRKQRPNNLSSASIWEIDDASATDTAAATFRFMPIVAQPETFWMNGVARLFPTDREAATSWPVALLDMYAWGAPQAGNVLADNLWAIDPSIAKILPELQHCVVKRMPGGQLQTVDSRAWKILGGYFKPIVETPTPAVLRTDTWGTRRLISAAAGWVDSLAAIAPDPTDKPKTEVLTQAAATSANTSSDTNPTADGITGGAATENNQTPRKASKIIPYHYLEPVPELYQRLELDAKKLQADLEAAHYYPENYRQRFGDFIRLFQRLTKIADTERQGLQISVVDRRLLATIDEILDKVDVPLPTVLSIEGNKKTEDSGKSTDDGLSHGFNMAIGRPGLLYIIYQNPRSMEWTLGRGAVYTYYEMPAPLLTESMWKHKIDAGFAKPPYWSNKFEIVQAPAPEANATRAATVGTGR